MTVECASCGGRFDAKRKTAKYCSPRCRKRAERAPQPAPPRRDEKPLAAVPPPPPFSAGLYEQISTELEQAGRLDTYLGQIALVLARDLDGISTDTGSARAALARELTKTMAAALDGVGKTESKLEELRRKRAERRVAGA